MKREDSLKPFFDKLGIEADSADETEREIVQHIRDLCEELGDADAVCTDVCERLADLRDATCVVLSQIQMNGFLDSPSGRIESKIDPLALKHLADLAGYRL